MPAMDKKYMTNISLNKVKGKFSNHLQPLFYHLSPFCDLPVVSDVFVDEDLDDLLVRIGALGELVEQLRAVEFTIVDCAKTFSILSSFEIPAKSQICFKNFPLLL